MRLTNPDVRDGWKADTSAIPQRLTCITSSGVQSYYRLIMQSIVDPVYLRIQAEKCVRLANDLSDRETAAVLRNLAMQYQIIAARVDEQAGQMAFLSTSNP